MLKSNERGDFLKKENYVFKTCCFTLFINLVLFFVKLYVSLSSNSISIFSDAINNLADSLSCALSAVLVTVCAKLSSKSENNLAGKIEQLLSFVLACVVFAVGLSFAYSSAERLMYPSPVCFSQLYFVLIAVTALIKLLMFLYFRKTYKKTSSSVMRVMKTDSLTDTCVTVVSLISFTLTKYTNITFDAFAGIFISVFIIAESIKLIKSSLFALLNTVSQKDKDKIEKIISANTDIKPQSIEYNVRSEEEIFSYISFEESALNEEFIKTLKKIKTEIFEETGIKVKIITI